MNQPSDREIRRDRRAISNTQAFKSISWGTFCFGVSTGFFVGLTFSDNLSNEALNVFGYAWFIAGFWLTMTWDKKLRDRGAECDGAGEGVDIADQDSPDVS